MIESSDSSNAARCLGFVAVDDVLRAVLGFAGFSSSSSSSSSTSTPASREEGLRRASESLCSTSVSEIQRGGDGRLVFRCSNSKSGGGAKRRREGERNGAASSSLSPPPSETSLLDVVRDGFLLDGEEKGNPACHRVAVCDFDFDDDDEVDDEDETGDGGVRAAAPFSFQKDSDSPPLRVVAIVSQSDVVRFLARHLGELKSSESESDEREPRARDVASAPVAAVAAAMPASLALASLFQQRARVSAAAILGTQHGELVGSLSASDLRGLSGSGPGSLRVLGLPVREFVEGRARARADAAAAVAADDDSDGGGGRIAAPPPPLLAVSPDTPLSELVRLLAEGGHHRAFVVEEETDDDGDGEEGKKAEIGDPRRRRRRATGVISLSDVLRFVCKG